MAIEGNSIERADGHKMQVLNLQCYSYECEWGKSSSFIFWISNNQQFHKYSADFPLYEGKGKFS